MTCKFIYDNRGLSGVLCTTPVYKFQGYYFEWHSFHGPTPVRRDNMKLRKTIPEGFWGMVEEFQKLTDEERREFQIG